MQVTAGLDRAIGVALKTVYADRCIGMAAAAEMFFTANTWCIRCSTHMTVDALDQAVLLVTDAFVDRFIALVEDVLHVVHAHVLRFLYAALCITEAALGFRNCREQVVCHEWRNYAWQHAQSKDDETDISHQLDSSLC